MSFLLTVEGEYRLGERIARQCSKNWRLLCRAHRSAKFSAPQVACVTYRRERVHVENSSPRCSGRCDWGDNESLIAVFKSQNQRTTTGCFTMSPDNPSRVELKAPSDSCGSSCWWWSHCHFRPAAKARCVISPIRCPALGPYHLLPPNCSRNSH